jgi:hypothetical protein
LPASPSTPGGSPNDINSDRMPVYGTGLKKKPQGVTVASTRHSPRQFPLHPYSAWRFAAAILEAGLRIGSYDVRNLVLAGPGLRDFSGPSWARHLRNWAMDRGVSVSMHTRHRAKATQPDSPG